MAKNSKDVQKKADSKRAGRTRNWCIIFYPEDLPDDWQLQIDSLHVKWIESPLHNNDFNDDGSHKKDHVHALFMFDSVKNEKQVQQMFSGLFGTSQNGSIIGVAAISDKSRCRDRSGSVRYMAHMDNPEKAQYDTAEIKGHNGADPMEILQRSLSETREMIVKMEEFIEENEIIELCDFSAAIRYDNPEWYMLLTTKMTTYFNAFIRSRRHRGGNKIHKNEINVNMETGEIIE